MNPVLLKAKVFPAALHTKHLQRMSTLTGEAKVLFPRGAAGRLHKGCRAGTQSRHPGLGVHCQPHLGVVTAPSGRVKAV